MALRCSNASRSVALTQPASESEGILTPFPADVHPPSGSTYLTIRKLDSLNSLLFSANYSIIGIPVSLHVVYEDRSTLASSRIQLQPPPCSVGLYILSYFASFFSWSSVRSIPKRSTTRPLPRDCPYLRPGVLGHKCPQVVRGTHQAHRRCTTRSLLYVC